MAHRTPKEVAENAVFWTNQLNSFFEDICAQKDDPSFTHPLDLNTRSYIWEAALACRGVTRSLDYVVVSVYKLIRRRAGCGVELDFQGREPQEFTTPHVNVFDLVSRLQAGGHERRVLTAYVGDVVEKLGVDRPQPAARPPTSRPVARKTLEQTLDEAYPFVLGDVYDKPRTTKNFLSGLKIVYDHRTHSVSPAFSRHQARLPATRPLLVDDPACLNQMWQAYTLLVEWVAKMEADKVVIPLAEFLRQHRQGVLGVPKGCLLTEVWKRHEHWRETKWLDSLADVKPACKGSGGTEAGEEDDQCCAGQWSSDSESWSSR